MRRAIRALFVGFCGFFVWLTLATFVRSETKLPIPLPSTVDAFDVEMRGWMAKNRVTRDSIAVMRDGRLVYSAGYGGRGANERIAIWSLSKAVTAFCIASLIGEGRLHIDDPIGPLLQKSFARYGQPADGKFAQVTVAQLLSHRAGFPQVVTSNGFAPGLEAVLRAQPPSRARSEMLMPQIVKIALAEPGSEYRYSNVGYLLLGQIIEGVMGQNYQQACARRVLEPAGIKAPAMDRTWGALLHAAGGWSLSGPEYLAFTRLLRPKGRDFLSASVRNWLESFDGKWMDKERLNAYTLGVRVRVLRGGRSNLFHSGSWNWKQRDSAGGPIDAKHGTWFVLDSEGVGWFASFDGVTPQDKSDARRSLDEALWRARRAVSSWPDHDQFPQAGVGPVSIDR